MCSPGTGVTLIDPGRKRPVRSLSLEEAQDFVHRGAKEPGFGLARLKHERQQFPAAQVLQNAPLPCDLAIRTQVGAYVDPGIQAVPASPKSMRGSGVGCHSSKRGSTCQSRFGLLVMAKIAPLVQLWRLLLVRHVAEAASAAVLTMADRHVDAWATA